MKVGYHIDVDRDLGLTRVPFSNLLLPDQKLNNSILLPLLESYRNGNNFAKLTPYTELNDDVSLIEYAVYKGDWSSISELLDAEKESIINVVRGAYDYVDPRIDEIKSKLFEMQLSNFHALDEKHVEASIEKNKFLSGCFSKTLSFLSKDVVHLKTQKRFFSRISEVVSNPKFKMSGAKEKVLIEYTSKVLQKMDFNNVEPLLLCINKNQKEGVNNNVLFDHVFSEQRSVHDVKAIYQSLIDIGFHYLPLAADATDKGIQVWNDLTIQKTLTQSTPGLKTKRF